MARARLSGAMPLAAGLTSATLVRRSAGVVDRFEGLAEVIRERVGGGDGVRAARESQHTLVGMGTVLRAAERTAPTHPHPSMAGSPIAQWMVGRGLP